MLVLTTVAYTAVAPGSGSANFPTQAGESRQVAETLVLQHGVSPDAGYAGTTDVVITNLWENAQLGGWDALDTYRDDQERHRILIRFDLGPLPPGAQIQSAALSLYHVDSEYDNAPQTVSAYRLTAPWTEGTGIETAPEPDGATYTLAAPGIPWATPGGDFDATGIASTVVPAFTFPGWIDWDLTGLMRQWASGAVPNYGVILRTSDADYFGHLFYSRNYAADAALRPR
ncbi:MAG: DNRLRE domain-containing protein, partial [Chloroflexi bacterium]|nr:DNRLRE domain-containing protein [Chloroflexota bacterium]